MCSYTTPALLAVDPCPVERCQGNGLFPLTAKMADVEGNGRREEKKEEEEDLERRLSSRETADAPTILLPCAICARTFKPQSLEKHRRICERSALKKRKPFDSAKQRIQGTELAEFAPKRETRRPSQVGSQERIRDRSPKSKSGWKQTHDQLLRALREARRENVDVPPRRQKTTTPASIATTTASSTTPTTATAASTLSVSSGAPTRANEKGTCPTCSRQFGIKAYDRHVAWCKERAIRLPLSPATNVAKERLEARMKYRAPILKNRRAFNREKYSPGSVGNFNAFGCKTSPTSPTSTTSTTSNTTAARESLSMPACNKIQETVLNPKQTVSSTTGRRLSHGGMPMAAPLTSVLPCSGSVTGSSKYCSADRNNRGKSRKVREAISLTSKCTCKSEKSKLSEEGTVRLNDIAVNEGVIGMTVRPCSVYRISHFDIDAGLACKRTPNVTEPTMLQRGCGTVADERCDEANSPGHGPRRTSSRISVAESTDRNTTLADDEDLDLTYSIINSLDGDRRKDEDPADGRGDTIEETRTLERTGEGHLPLVQESAARCATYVIEETSGERKVLRRKMRMLRKNREELEETVRITTSSEEPVRLRIHEKYVNGNFESQGEEEKEVAVPKKTQGSTERRIARHLSKDFDSRTTSARITERRIRERMKALRGSTDSLISSIERTDRTERASCVASIEPADQAEPRSEPLPAIVTNYVRRRYDSRNLIKSNENTSYWEKVSQVVENRREVKWTEPLNKERLLIRNRKIQNLPPVIPSPKASQPNFHSDIGTSAEPVVTDLQSDDPFYLAERQMNELSSTDASDRSIDPTITITDHSPSTLNSNFPLSRSPSAFVKYVGHFDLNRNSNPNRSMEKRSSVIAPPSQFDDLTSSEFSSDSTETNSLSREIFTEAFCESAASRQHRIVIDKSRPSANLDANSNSGRDKTFVNSRKILERVSGKTARPTVNRSQSVRSTSAPGPPVSQERNRSNKKGNLRASGHSTAAAKPTTDQISKGKKKIVVSADKNNLPMSISNLSLSSIVSSELDVKRPNYMREEFTSSFEDDAASSSSFPLLRSFLKTDLAFAPSSPIDRADRTDRTNAQRNSEDDEENLSSPESYKRHDRDPTKHTVDSAYSSLNRKYSNHGHSGEDVVALGSRRFYEDDVVGTPPRCKMSKFCHECGSRFPETAKFCCECGVRRLAF